MVIFASGSFLNVTKPDSETGRVKSKSVGHNLITQLLTDNYYSFTDSRHVMNEDSQSEI